MSSSPLPSRKRSEAETESAPVDSATVQKRARKEARKEALAKPPTPEQVTELIDLFGDSETGRAVKSGSTTVVDDVDFSLLGEASGNFDLVSPHEVLFMILMEYRNSQ